VVLYEGQIFLHGIHLSQPTWDYSCTQSVGSGHCSRRHTLFLDLMASNLTMLAGGDPTAFYNSRQAQSSSPHLSGFVRWSLQRQDIKTYLVGHSSLCYKDAGIQSYWVIDHEAGQISVYGLNAECILVWQTCTKSRVRQL